MAAAQIKDQQHSLHHNDKRIKLTQDIIFTGSANGIQRLTKANIAAATRESTQRPI
jgi:hypothetical protein